MKTKSLSIFLVALFVVGMNLGAEEEMPFEEEKNNDDKNEKNKGIEYEIIKEKIYTYNFSLKILLIGDDNVGKSALITKIYNNNFLEKYIPTVGFEFFYLNFKIVSDEDKPVLRYQIYDFGGKENYRNLNQSFYKNARVCLLAYDVNDKKSFNDIDGWVNDVKSNNTNEPIHFVLIGNKIDLERVVSKETGKNFAEEKGMEFVEVSAKTDAGIKDLEKILAKIIYEEFMKYKKEKEVEEEKKEEDDSEDDFIEGEKPTRSSFLCDCCKKICENC